MQQDLFKKLPQEITIDILSRLPVRTIMSCKCVCKPWLDLVETPEFVKSHLSKSVPGLAAFQGSMCSKPYKYFEFVDEPESEIEDHCGIVFNFTFPHPTLIHSSADGLLFLLDHKRIFSFDHKRRPQNLFICNPITRDYIKVPDPQESSPSNKYIQLDTFGFGVSKMTGQYKLVRISHECIPSPGSDQLGIDNQSKCQVYTLGTRSWRSIASSGPLTYECNNIWASLNGNLHFLACDLKGSTWISCFDLETELFSLFSSSHLPYNNSNNRSVSVLRGCLSLCDNSSTEIVIWLMNEYGDEKSWSREFVITKINREFCGTLWPIKVFEDGDILIARKGCSKILCYSSKTKTIRVTALIELHGYDGTSAVSYTPSFLQLKTFTMEKLLPSVRTDSVTGSPPRTQDIRSIKYPLHH